MSLILVHLMEDGFHFDHLCLVGVEWYMLTRNIYAFRSLVEKDSLMMMTNMVIVLL